MSIRIVTHCWAQKYEHYATHLRFHLSYLIEHPPKVATPITVFSAKEDKATNQVVRDLMHRLPFFAGSSHIYQSPTVLGRRSIGRNLEGLSCNEDLIWYADTDILFGEGCLDSLWDTWLGMENDGVTLMFPQTCNYHNTDSYGDNEITKAQNQRGTVQLDHDPKLWYKKRYNVAIGGFQISPGDYARQHGYVNAQFNPRWKKWQEPQEKPFANTKEDIKYRTQCGAHGKTKRIELPNLYRMKHSNVTHHD